MEIFRETDKAKKWRQLAFILGVTFYSYSNIINMLFTSAIGPNSIDTLMTLALLLFVTAMYLYHNGLNIKVDIIVLLLGSIVLFVLDRVHPMKNTETYNMIINLFFSQAIVGYLYARTLDDFSEIYKCLKYIAGICFISAFFIPFMPKHILVSFGGDVADKYGAYMLFGYRMLPPVVLYWYLGIKEKKIIYQILSIIGAFETVVFGNRGAVVAILVFIFGYMLFYTNKKIITLLIFALIFGAYMWMTSEQGINIIMDFLNDMGLQSRNIEKFLGGSISESGRDYQYEHALNLIKENLLFGVGISGSWIYGYPHNIVLEILSQIGIVLGIAVILCFTTVSLKILLKKTLISEIYLCFFCIGMIKMLFSSSYLMDGWFWTMMGILVASANVKSKDPVIAQ